MPMTGWSQGAGHRARVKSSLVEARGAMTLGLYGRAKRAIARAIALGWRTSSAYRDLAVACAAEGEWDHARRAMALGWSFARSAQDAFTLLRVSGEIAFRRGDYPGAVTAWQQALALRPEWDRGWYRLGLASAYSGAYRTAEMAFRTCARGGKGDDWVLPAVCAYLASMPRVAASHLHLAVRQGVSTPRHARALGALAVALGEQQLALNWAQECASDARFAPIEHEVRALLAWLEGDMAASACLAKKAVMAGGQHHALVYLAMEAGNRGAGFHGHHGQASSTMDAQEHRTNRGRECDASGMDHRGFGDDGA